LNKIYIVIFAFVLMVGSFVWMAVNFEQGKGKQDIFNDPIYSVLKKEGKIKRAKQMPNQWFYMQRAYPYKSIPKGKFLSAIDEAKTLRKNSKGGMRDIVWEVAGPTNIPGRVTDIIVPHDDTATIYVASAAGGIFKSTDNGVNWTAIFDDEGVPSMGALAIHPDNSDIIYAGTGEANSSGDSYEGVGIYKSIDGGVNWEYKGLPESYYIGRIVIDPLRPETVYVAASGLLFGTNSERGVYRSINGGDSWEQMLYVDDTTGCIDIALHPSTGTLMAAMWYRYRSATVRRVGNYQCGIFRSTDAGDNWTRLSVGLPAQADTVGRIGITIDPESQTAYAIYANHPGYFMGVYKTTDLGDNWVRVNDGALEDIYSSFGWYFGNIRVVPGHPDTVFALGVQQFRSTNGGGSWHYADDNLHVDHHAMFIHPENINLIYNGNDGGVGISSNLGASWTQSYNMPNTQFYAITIDINNPERLYGGTQDNGSMRTLSGSIGDWQRFLGGDGFYCIVDYTNSNIIYGEYQNGYLMKSTDGGYGWYSALGNMDYYADRHNWSTPVAMDPVEHNTLYYGSQRVWKTTNGGSSWDAVSNDLTDGPGAGGLTYGTISTIDVSPADNMYVYIGTDDGHVWKTQNGGGLWIDIGSTLPIKRWVTRVTADPIDRDKVYVTLSGYKQMEPTPRVFRTDDGITWYDISGNLPDAPLNDVVVDPSDDSTLYVASDVGVYYTEDMGINWLPLGSGLPIVPIHDLALHDSTRTLVAGTHGRSMFKINLACIGPDGDSDGFADVCDNCPDTYNPTQADMDNDTFGDACDNCPITYNPNQEDTDSDTYGDVCDNCPDDNNPDQNDTDDDNLGNVCDNCPDKFNPLQEDIDGDTVGDSCDNCIDVYNPGQEDADGDAIGDVCDYICGDANGDGIHNIFDITFLISYLYVDGSAPDPIEAGDANGDGTINIFDITHLITFLYLDGPEPICPE